MRQPLDQKYRKLSAQYVRLKERMDDLGTEVQRRLNRPGALIYAQTLALVRTTNRAIDVHNARRAVMYRMKLGTKFGSQSKGTLQTCVNK
jgi:hypothetical protein